ncbi:hypothetical protein [Armatimonas sp.]|uniref:hypothetical protein n=1 Tax=Armatimonas sp. TaxID=1872638 RepID=UPI0037501FAF
MNYALLASALLLAPTLAHPQQSPDAPRAKSEREVREVAVSVIVRQLGQDSGQNVLVDSSLAALKAPALAKATTKENLEEQLDSLLRKLPDGTAWAKLYLPKPQEGKRYAADNLSRYAMAQAGLFGGKVGASKPGMVEVMGRLMTQAEANPLIQKLDLVPYYILSNPRRPAMAFGGPSGNGAGSPFGGANISDLLMKQLGVSDLKDVPSGSYKVQLPGPDGNPVTADVKVNNEGGNTSIAVRIGQTSTIPPQ